ncbi:hypothetical protein DY000_02040385 [Brassica cretica]|uniref:Uncharacterized protein n=1 Tax=Brassica cretica TaxID=69181 RepID=A0ABQ7B695_BRACR|nr:hypothetical protein DY000_02040385 [Brassica cretica]
MNCTRAGVENQNGCEIRTTSGTQNHHVLPPSSSHHQKKKKKNENNVMEKGKKSKKHEPLGRSSKKLVPSIEEATRATVPDRAEHPSACSCDEDF